MNTAFSRRDFANRRVQRRRDNILKKIGVAGIGIVVFLVLITVLLRIEAVQFSEVIVEGERHISEQEVGETINQQLAKRLAFVLPRSNVLLFSSKDTEEQLRAHFPRIAEVKVRREIFARTLRIELVERDLWMVFCSKEESDCVSVSRDGIAYAQSPTFSGNLVTKIINEEGHDINLGSEILTKELRDIILLYTEEGTAIAEIGRPQFVLRGKNEIRIYSAEGWYVIADLTSDSEQAYHNMVVTLREEIGENRENLAYIDTRFGSRVFYRNK